MDNLDFWKLFTERSFHGKKLMRLKITYCTPNKSFPLSSLKVHQCRFEYFPICSCLFKNNYLKISHSLSTECSSYLPVKFVFVLNISLFSNIFYCFSKTCISQITKTCYNGKHAASFKWRQICWYILKSPLVHFVYSF